MTSSPSAAGPSDQDDAQADRLLTAAVRERSRDAAPESSAPASHGGFGSLFAAAFMAFLLVWALFGQRAGDIAFVAVMFGFPALGAAVVYLVRFNRLIQHEESARAARIRQFKPDDEHDPRMEGPFGSAHPPSPLEPNDEELAGPAARTQREQEHPDA